MAFSPSQLRLLTIAITLLVQGCVLGINIKDCGSFDAVKHTLFITDKIADNASPLTELGALASLHRSFGGINRHTHKCGGVLISDRYLLTAAHCMVATEKPNKIILGSPNIDSMVSNDFNNIFEIERVMIHPEYHSETHERHKYNDIALLMTDRKVVYSSNVWPFCLPKSGTVLRNNQLVQIAGWGIFNQVQTSATIKQAFVKITNNTQCASEWRSKAPQVIDSTYPSGINIKLLCAGRPGVDACKGDSGGPMSYEDQEGHETVIGIISNGIPCAETPILPGFYSNVASFTDWIVENTGISTPQGLHKVPQVTLSTHPASTFPSKKTENGATTKRPQPLPITTAPWWVTTTSTPRPTNDYNPVTTAPIRQPIAGDTSSLCSSLPGKSGNVADPDLTYCDAYYNCVHGVATKSVCSKGLHFDEKTGICNWSYNVSRQDCGKNNHGTCSSDQFKCPNGDCIRDTWHCDAKDDCGDWADEETCYGRINGCPYCDMRCRKPIYGSVFAYGSSVQECLDNCCKNWKELIIPIQPGVFGGSSLGGFGNGGQGGFRGGAGPIQNTHNSFGGVAGGLSSGYDSGISHGFNPELNPGYSGGYGAGPGVYGGGSASGFGSGPGSYGNGGNGYGAVGGSPGSFGGAQPGYTQSGYPGGGHQPRNPEQSYAQFSAQLSQMRQHERDQCNYAVSAFESGDQCFQKKSPCTTDVHCFNSRCCDDNTVSKQNCYSYVCNY